MVHLRERPLLILCAAIFFGGFDYARHYARHYARTWIIMRGIMRGNIPMMSEGGRIMRAQFFQ